MSTTTSPRAIAIPRRHAKPRPLAEVVTRTATSSLSSIAASERQSGPEPSERAVLDEQDLGAREMSEALDEQSHRAPQVRDLVVDGDDVADGRVAHAHSSMAAAISWAGRIELRSWQASALPSIRSRKWRNWSASGSPVWRTKGMSTTVSAR